MRKNTNLQHVLWLIQLEHVMRTFTQCRPSATFIGLYKNVLHLSSDSKCMCTVNEYIMDMIRMNSAIIQADL